MKKTIAIIVLALKFLYEFVKSKDKEITKEQRKKLDNEIEDYTRLYERAIREGNSQNVIYYSNLIQRRLRKISRSSSSTVKHNRNSFNK